MQQQQQQPSKTWEENTTTTTTIHFNSQRNYSHGTCMCTTACLQMAVAVLCSRINLSIDDGKTLQKKLNHIMDLASKSHARLEQQLNPNKCTQPPPARMVSVFEIIQERRINLSKLNIHMEEFFVVSSSSPGLVEEEGTSITTNTTILPTNRDEDSPTMKYKPPSCFIQPHQIPMCLVTNNKDNNVSAATATSNSHTVCLLYYHYSHDVNNGCYAFFDPLPGTLSLRLTSQELLQKLWSALHLDDSHILLPSLPPLPPSQEQKEDFVYRRGKKFPRDDNESGSTEGRDIMASAAKKIRSMFSSQPSTSSSSPLHLQCDITLLHKRTKNPSPVEKKLEGK